MKDTYQRNIDYLRISVTDRCNFRCRYCMPPEETAVLTGRELLNDEEILEIAQAAVSLGIRKFKVTGGEPLIRPGVPELIGNLKRLPGAEQVTLTTNGSLLPDQLEALRANGLDTVNISLDTLDRERFAHLTGQDALLRVLEGIRKAQEAGLRVKINTVLRRDENEEEWHSIALLAKDRPLDVRFIELMPIGAGRGLHGVSGEAVYERLRLRYPDVEPDRGIHGNGPAVYVHIPGWQGSVGFISAVHRKFCAACNRLRLTSDGSLKPCLCYAERIDLKPLLRSSEYAGEDKKEQRRRILRQEIRKAVLLKPAEHCFEEPSGISETRKMWEIGG